MAVPVSLLISTLVLSAAASPWGPYHGPGIDTQPLSPCYYSEDLCKCAAGTTFAVSHTTQTLGANAADFKALAGNFLNVTWEGLQPTSTTGKNNVAGATRNASIPTTVGTYLVTEKLVRYDNLSDGTFAMYFDLAYPVEFHNGQGSFGGYWVTFQTAYTGKDETYVNWKINSCVTGSPFNFTTFKEGSLATAEKILKGEGKLNGESFSPVTDACG